MFPLVPVVFTSIYPFTYVTYKMLEVHYFLIVIGAVFGFGWLIARSLQRRLWPAVVALWCLVGFVVGVNVVGTIMNSRISLQRVLPFDMTDLSTLATRIRAANLPYVMGHVDSGNLAFWVIRYQLANAGVEYRYGINYLGRPSITPQDYVFSKIAPKDVVMRSDKGKYVLTHTPESQLDVQASLSPERSNGVVFLWLSNELEYNTLNLEPDIRSLAAYVKSLPGSPVVCNDLSDSGYYLAVDFLLNKYDLKHSDDPRQCTYFIRLNPRLVKAVDEETDLNASPLVKFLVAPVSANVGQPKVVANAFEKRGGQPTRWSGELFQAVEIPAAGRQMSPPPGMDVNALVDLLREKHLSVANEYPATRVRTLFPGRALAGSGHRSGRLIAS